MQVIETAIQDVYIIKPRIFADERGYFFESYNQNAFEKAGLNYTFIQDNQSKSCYGTVRGLHFQKGAYAQAKLVRVLDGTVLDVAVDLRKNSPTFGKHVAVELSADNNLQLLIPRGFAHGFSVLSETAIFAYKCDNVYNKESEGGLLFCDDALGIDWRIPHDAVLLSEKDTVNPSLAEITTSLSW